MFFFAVFLSFVFLFSQGRILRRVTPVEAGSGNRRRRHLRDDFELSIRAAGEKNSTAPPRERTAREDASCGCVEKREREFSGKTLGTKCAEARLADFQAQQRRPSRNVFYVSSRRHFYSGKMNERSFTQMMREASGAGGREGAGTAVAVLSQFYSSYCSASIIGIVLFRRLIFNANTREN